MTDETNPKDKIGATKPSISLIPPVALVHISMAMKNGADKYGAYNWMAPDSLLDHLAHIGANAAILLDAKESGNLIDNRPTKGKASEVMQKYTSQIVVSEMTTENQNHGLYDDISYQEFSRKLHNDLL